MGGPPQADLVVVKVIRVVGGEVTSSATLAPRMGAIGVSPKVIGEALKKATADYKGIKVTCRITFVNRKIESVDIVPSASSLIIKALKEPPRNRKTEKNIVHDGSISIDQLIEIAETLRPASMCREFSGTVKNVLGTCQSIGCKVNDEEPQDVIAQVNAGEIDFGDRK